MVVGYTPGVVTSVGYTLGSRPPDPPPYVVGYTANSRNPEPGPVNPHGRTDKIGFQASGFFIRLTRQGRSRRQGGKARSGVRTGRIGGGMGGRGIRMTDRGVGGERPVRWECRQRMHALTSHACCHRIRRRRPLPGRYIQTEQGLVSNETSSRIPVSSAQANANAVRCGPSPICQDHCPRLG